MEKVGFELCRSLGSKRVEKAERAFQGLRDRMGHVVQVGARGRAGLGDPQDLTPSWLVHHYWVPWV